MALTYEQPGNVATANGLINRYVATREQRISLTCDTRRIKALRDEQQALSRACVDTFMCISQVEPLVNVQRGRIRKHQEILQDLARTRSQVQRMLQGCHSVMDEISTVQLQVRLVIY